MKWHFLIPLFFLVGTPTVLRAQTALPDLTIKEQGKKQSLALRDLSIDVRLEGQLVETILELEFYNHSGRRQEGEFVLTLPEGATVSTYALDIQGNMRPGVAVEKDKARKAYESIKRRQVDPGLVEREKGNVYRTRIFPIEPNQNKRVRIGYIQVLPDDGEYVFPMHRDEVIRKFTCVVRGTDEAPELASNGLADTPKKMENGSWKWSARNVDLDGELKTKAIPLKQGAPIVHVERQADGSAHFLVQGLSHLAEDDDFKQKWKKIRLVWDGSYSGRWRDREKELAALRWLWKWHEDCEVSVQILNTSLDKGRIFRINRGESAEKELEKYLRGIIYDGAADFSKIGPWDGITLLMTDGELSSSVWAPGINKFIDDCFLLTATAGQIAPGLLPPGMKWIDLRNENWMARLTRPPLAVRIEGLSNDEFDVTRNGDQFIVSGKVPKDFNGRVLHQSLRGVIRINALAKEGGQNKWNFVRRAWAQRKLVALEGQGNRSRITEFAKGERLVSDFTSLIVLEEFADHVRYQIPPPEPELLIRYNRALKHQSVTMLNSTVREWKRKITWHETDFPWLDANLEEEIAAVGIWVKSSYVAFPNDKVNMQSLAPFEKWMPKAEKIVAGKSELKAGESFKSWSRQLDASLAELKEIRNTPQKRSEDQPVHVSVRGFVRDRGIYSKANPFYLNEAIEEAGGPNQFGSRSRVYLYSRAQRTGYNLSSRNYQKIKLQWGDMVVVEGTPAWMYLSGAGDPFSAPEGERGPEHESPVFEERGTRRSTIPTAQAMSANAVSGNRENSVLDESLDGRRAGVQARGIDQHIIKSLRDHPDPVKRYAELLQGDFGKSRVSMATVIEIARIFFKEKRPVSAEDVLSTLLELQSNPIESTRTLAYWLAEFGETKSAIELLQALAEIAPDEPTRALIYFDLGQLSGEGSYFRQSIESGIKSPGISEVLPFPDPFGATPQIDWGSNDTVLSTISLTDYFAKKGNTKGSLRQFEKSSTPSDVRIVITTIGDHVTPETKEPLSAIEGINHGAWILNGQRVYEYQMRRGLPGSYNLSLLRWRGNFLPVTIHVRLYTRWGGGKEKVQTRTILMEGPKLDLGSLDFNWSE